jgi:transcriptional regulator with XRE-family HTH domain
LFRRKYFWTVINGETLKSKRVAVGIGGHVLCKKLAIARSRLSDIERGYATAKPEELARINTALDDLTRTKGVLQQTAAALGWPTSGVA